MTTSRSSDDGLVDGMLAAGEDDPNDSSRMDSSLTIATCVAIAKRISVEDAEAFLAHTRNHRERTHTLGPIEDPTAYRVTGPQADVLVGIADAFYKLRLAIQAGQDHAAQVKADAALRCRECGD